MMVGLHMSPSMLGPRVMSVLMLSSKDGPRLRVPFAPASASETASLKLWRLTADFSREALELPVPSGILCQMSQLAKADSTSTWRQRGTTGCEATHGGIACS